MTAPDEPRVEVLNNPSGHRYEIRADGQMAGFCEYRPAPEHLTLLHTEIDPAFEGLGLGSQLARGALDDVRAHHLTINPQCEFIAGYIRRHAEYVDLVDEGHRHRFQSPGAP